MKDFFLDLWAFMKERKKYWLVPLVIVILLMGVLVALAPNSVLAPFIYTVF